MRAEEIQSVLVELPLVGALTAAGLRWLAAAVATAAAALTAAAWIRRSAH